ncbi:unnamed protein product [Chrysodeixis includens]|uniref:Uncharacterized protein n=1 Tax=Chrysodeixis includens TaxID=689277 RepID=A0A9N8KY68_CHRIL|nr:unnamed protein product [Chrysodeixis includens]
MKITIFEAYECPEETIECSESQSSRQLSGIAERRVCRALFSSHRDEPRGNQHMNRGDTLGSPPVREPRPEALSEAPPLGAPPAAACRRLQSYVKQTPQGDAEHF